MFRTASHEKDEYQAIIEETEKINEEFMLRQKEKFPKSNVVLRTGIYYVTPECRSTSYAIDAANYVRQKVKGGEKGSVRFYDDEMQKQRELENEIVNDMKEAMEQKQFKVYFQPQYSIKSHEIIGAEALVRWERDNGTVLSPNAFIPVYENNGKIIELDFYVFETVVEFIAENLKAGREQVPISINASSLHASDPQTINTYINILKKYSVDPTMVEIELTETAVVSEYESVRKLFDSFQLHGIKTAMDDRSGDLKDEEKALIQQKLEENALDDAINILKKNAQEVEADEEIKNTIGNLTLLDAATNRSYGNSLFCTKRRIIIERIKQGVFVPVATQYIFAKFFDPKGTNRSLWTRDDMEAYHKYIYNALITYVNNEED